MLNLTGRALFKEFNNWQFGSLDYTQYSIIPASSLRKNNTDTIPIRARFRYNWGYHIEYQFWVEIGWEDYKNLPQLVGNLDLKPVKASLPSVDTDAYSFNRTQGDIEIFPEKMGILRPATSGIAKLDGSLITEEEAPFFLTVWHYKKANWSGLLINQIVTKADGSLTTIAQVLLNGYMGYSKYRQSYVNISMSNDHHFSSSGLLLVSLLNRNITNPKYIYGTCRVKLDYNINTLEKSLSSHYHQHYAQWNT